MKREESIDRIRSRQHPWDIVVIGGGATGVAIALDASTRGLDALLVEQSDFGKGTSSRSTKLVHGGVRYLEQGNLTLVRDALRERTLLRQLAPMLVHDLPFFIPCNGPWQRFYFWVGLKLYDLLAGRSGFGKSHTTPASTANELLPTLRPEMHRGGVIYHDGQFDDCRLLIHMARTASEHGACMVNYMAATGLQKDTGGAIQGVELRDRESNTDYFVSTRCVINAGGPFSDAVMRLDDPSAEPRLAASQGVHIVLPRLFFPGDTALIVPRTSDGRVLFMIPWNDHVVIGTTDTPIVQAVLEPTPQQQEIDFLLNTSADYLTQAPKMKDVTSIFTGVRPLVKNDRSTRTASLSRDHSISISDAGLVTIRGGKWTTVRKMAEDCVDRAIESAGLQATPCHTQSIPLHRLAGGKRLIGGASPAKAGIFTSPDSAEMASMVTQNPDWDRPITGLPTMRVIDVIWSVRNEMARTVEDVLARRTRHLFLDAEASLQAAADVAAVLASELGRNEVWQREQIDAFKSVAQNYLNTQFV
ncbi:MAG TPA: FAD-dependent oxidoreductase [Planctomycetaceae bacterium]|nr:FAD-dependent oxidoreductase [Planctomycetaceae bacterium]